LIIKNGFKETLLFVQLLREIAHLTDNILILSIDPAAVAAKGELRLLEKETLEVEPRFMARLTEDMLEVLRFVYRQNNLGVKPNYSAIRLETKVSKPTVSKRVKRLMAAGYLVDSVKGSSKVVELTRRGRNLFS
jgi:DNA-binding MarR family transcriptional regulator